VSPDGQSVSYLKNGDLWLFDPGSRQSRALSDIGIGPLSTLRSPYDSGLPTGRYSRPEREIGPGIWGGPTYAWAPDGKTIAVHYVDRRAMRKVPFPNYLAPETDPNETRRGYPGDANESRQVGLLRVADGELTLLDTIDPSAHQIVGFSWSREGVLLLDIASDTAVDRWLYTVDLDSGGPTPREIWHSHRPTRIYTSFASRWHPDSRQVIFLSDLEDRYGLYAINAFAGSAKPRRLSAPAADVTGAPDLTASGDLFYSASTAQGSESQVYRIDLEDTGERSGAAWTQVTSVPGINSGYPSPDGQQLAFLHSSDSAPPELYLTSTDSTAAQRITHSPLPEFARRDWAEGRYVSFPSHIDDYRLHARILEPKTLVAGQKYPVLFGPMYSNTVRNRWAGIYSRVQQLLVQRGYIVVQVDMRGSTGYGREFREEFLTDFAGNDIEDIVSTVEYLKTLPYIDSERMGIWGSSYGGTLSVYSLLKKPGLFRAGVAAAAAVDPYFFGTDDVAIVRRPDTQPDIFLNQAARYAANLEDHLLIIHGMQDQVVPFKTTAALADILIRNGKDFDFAFAPGATHAWSREAFYSQYLFGKMLTHFDRYLMPKTQ
jgi:dipeptidyl-peptidase-4